MLGENYVVEQVYRVNDTQVMARAVKSIMKLKVAILGGRYIIFTCVLWRHKSVILCSSLAAAKDSVW
jgi:hypothetical protein